MDERELPTLEQYAAIGRREASAACSAVRDHLADGELAGERFALRFEIDPGRETFDLAAAGIGAPQLRDHR